MIYAHKIFALILCNMFTDNPKFGVIFLFKNINSVKFLI